MLQYGLISDNNNRVLAWSCAVALAGCWAVSKVVDKVLASVVVFHGSGFFSLSTNALKV